MDRKGFLSTPGLILLTVLLPVAMLMTSSGFAQAPGEQNTSGFLALSGEEAANFDLPPDMQLIQSSYNVQNGLTYERYQQYFGVAQVLGAQVTLYIDDSGTIATVIGAHYPDIAPANFARLSGANARAVVDRDVGAGGNRNIDLLINPETGRYFHRIETQRPYSRWFHWIDADNGRVLNKYDAIETHHASGDASGVKGDIKIMEHLADLSLTTLHSSGRPQNRGYWLQSPGNRQLTYDDGNNGGVANIMIDDDNHWHDEPGPNSLGQPAGVDAHFYASVVDDYYQAIHVRDSFNNGGASMVSIVHIGDDLNNAFWNGQQVVYGDGDGINIRELSGALDVVAHEWTHAVTDYTSNLIYQNESGALNESFSDQMGTSIEFYADEAFTSNCTLVGDQPTCADWRVGEDVWMFTDETKPGLRNMADPAEYGDPDHYLELENIDEIIDNGGVHSNSGIPNHAYYLLTEGGSNAGETLVGHSHAGSGPVVVGIGLGNAQKIFYQAFTALSSGATMCAARDATVAMAATLFNNPSQQFTSTTDAWAAVGLTDSECGVTLPDTTAPATPTGLTTSAGDGSVSLDWNDNNTEPDLDGYNVYRSNASGGPYDNPINLSLIGKTTYIYTDNNVTNGTTYYYVVTAVDTSNNESENSAPPASATPSGGEGGESTTMHVQSIVLTTQNQGGGSKSAQATVTILDDLGNPVSGANVTGGFSGVTNETVTYNNNTDGQGQAVLTTIEEVKGRLKFMFCLIDVSLGNREYDLETNVTVCNSN